MLPSPLSTPYVAGKSTIERQMNMQLHGVHHVTAVTSDVGVNADFYTRVLGLRLVKKTVNQDDVSAYHLFYADKLGSPGTDMTFFDWPMIGPSQRGTDSIATTLFRVNGRAALDYWAKRLDEHMVKHGEIETFFERDMLRFEDLEGQRLALIDDGGAAFEGEVWDGAGVPLEHAIRGFYGITLSTPRLNDLGPILTQILEFAELAHATHADGETLARFGMDGGGPGKEVFVIEQPAKRPERLGAGGVHHVAFRVKDEAEQRLWRQKLTQSGVGVSQFIDRFYFKSIYFRISNGILFEIATDGPGFTADEPLETLGVGLALPPFLEPHRKEIEAGLKPIPVLNS
jgi:glyoxalase family protein